MQKIELGVTEDCHFSIKRQPASSGSLSYFWYLTLTLTVIQQRVVVGSILPVLDPVLIERRTRKAFMEAWSVVVAKKRIVVFVESAAAATE